jgi:hypothetical protein
MTRIWLGPVSLGNGKTTRHRAWLPSIGWMQRAKTSAAHGVIVCRLQLQTLPGVVRAHCESCGVQSGNRPRGWLTCRPREQRRKWVCSWRWPARGWVGPEACRTAGRSLPEDRPPSTRETHPMAARRQWLASTGEENPWPVAPAGYTTRLDMPHSATMLPAPCSAYLFASSRLPPSFDKSGFSLVLSRPSNIPATVLIAVQPSLFRQNGNCGQRNCARIAV